MEKGKKGAKKGNSTGEKMILSALQMDDALAELIRAETKNMKKLLEKEDCGEEITQMSNLLKKIISAMVMTEERIMQGIEIYKLELKERTMSKEGK